MCGKWTRKPSPKALPSASARARSAAWAPSLAPWMNSTSMQGDLTMASCLEIAPPGQQSRLLLTERCQQPSRPMHATTSRRSGERTMWTASTSIDTTASPQALWRLFEDVAGWTAWNSGIQRIALHGPFASGSTFDMQPPGMDALTSTLRDVRPDAGFVDETVIDGTRFLVSHELQALPSGG